MSHILIVGQKFSSLTSYLADHGHTYTQLRDLSRMKHKDKKYPYSINTDFSDPHGVEQALSELSSRPDAVIATYENYIFPAAIIAKKLGLPGLPVATAEACTDKYIMRGLFAKAPTKVSPAFALIENEEQLRDFAVSHDFPLILKPTNLAKSLLVTKNHDLQELLDNYQKSMELLHGTYKKYAPDRNPQLIIEEFLQGSIHSVDAFVDQNGEPRVLEQVVDYQTGYDIGYDDNFHYSRILPSKLSEHDKAELRKCAEVGIRALGMKNSPAHVEIIMTPKGPQIVEIGARNGGYRERMHKLANGIDITGAALSLALGKKPIINSAKNDSCAVLEIFPKAAGLFDGISSDKELESLPSLNYLSIKAKVGEHVGKSADGYKMCAVIILHNQDAEQFATDLKFVRKHVSAKTN